MTAFGDKPFGLHDVKVTNIGGTTQVDLPVAQKLTVKLNFKSGILSGDDLTKAVTSFPVDGDWELEAGGITPAALAILTGIAVTAAGTTPNQTNTQKFMAGSQMPYFKIYGQSLGDGIDDIHVKLYKCKITEFDGEWSDGNFFVTKCKGKAVDDGTNGIWQVVQNETSATLPTS